MEGNLSQDLSRSELGWREKTTTMEAIRVLPRCFCLEQRWTWLLHPWRTCYGYTRVFTLQGVS
jgi:hypothetical protein